MSEKESPYQLFTREILSMWTSQDVSYIKVEELSNIDGTTFYELIPDSELLDGGGYETIYSIDSEDVGDMLIADSMVKFVVHRVYLEEEY